MTVSPPQQGLDLDGPITGLQAAGVAESFRYSLFRVGSLIAMALVPVATGLSLTRRANMPGTVGATVIVALPLMLVALRPVPAWRLVLRTPSLLLAIGPLTVAAGTVGDRSAFYYPELLWVAGAAIVGGVGWSLRCAAVFTLGTTVAGMLSGQLNGRQALSEAITVSGPRLVLALLMAGLFAGLAQIVWLATVSVAQPQLPLSSLTPSTRPPRSHAEERAVDASLSPEVYDAIVVTPDDSSPPASAELDAPIALPQAVPPFKRLTALERTLLEVMADGHSVAAAAGLLGIKARTARARIERARKRNGCRSTTALIRSARENGELAGWRD